MDSQPSLIRKLDDTGGPLLIARLLLGGLFIYMAVSKVANPIDFLKLIREYHMVPEHPPFLLNLLAAVLPWVEIWCGLMLIAGVALRGTALLILVMLVGFTIVVLARAIGIYQAQDIAFCAIKFDCGCGTGEEWICQKVPKNLGLCLLSLIVLVSRSRRFCLRGDLFARRPGTPAYPVLD